MIQNDHSHASMCLCSAETFARNLRSLVQGTEPLLLNQCIAKIERSLDTFLQAVLKSKASKADRAALVKRVRLAQNFVAL